MLSIGWSEIGVICLVAVIFIGPNELPKVLFTLGRWVRKMRGFASVIQNEARALSKEAEIDYIQEKAKNFRFDEHDMGQYAHYYDDYKQFLHNNQPLVELEKAKNKTLKVKKSKKRSSIEMSEKA